VKNEESISEPINLIFWCSGDHIVSVVVKGWFSVENSIVAPGIKEYKNSFFKLNYVNIY